MLVVDASAAIEALKREGEARDALRKERLHAPDHVDVEVANALRRQELASVISAEHATAALHTWTTLGIHRYPIRRLLARIWELRHNLSAYDAAYVALAEALTCPLLTADTALARSPAAHMARIVRS